ncbi:MAG: hypothetical protein HYW88_03435 [Candidatus Sungbacteria bacterium]|nr:hypothetical protein [Candidatus Sungbacteria bacterium]
MERKKLCYIIPEYDPKTATHFAHLYDLLKITSKDLDIFLIIERGEFPNDTEIFSHTRLLKTSFLPIRVLGTAFMLFSARMRGYKDFYIHYSFFSALSAFVVAKAFGGRVFYWNAGEPWKYKRGKLREFF